MCSDGKLTPDFQEKLARIYLDVARDHLKGVADSADAVNGKIGILLPASLVIVGLMMNVEPKLPCLRILGCLASLASAFMFAMAYAPTAYLGGERLKELYDKAEQGGLPAHQILMQMASTLDDSAIKNQGKVWNRAKLCRRGMFVLLSALVLFVADYVITLSV